MNTPLYHKQNPLPFCYSRALFLVHAGIQKRTLHLVLDLKGSGLTYHAGDSIGVFPKHAPELVQKTLQALGASGVEMIEAKPTGEKISLAEFLSSRGNLTTVSPKLFREVLAANQWRKAAAA